MSSYRVKNRMWNTRLGIRLDKEIAKLSAENNANLELRKASLEVDSSFSTQYVDRFDGFHDND